jgi:hypothetical protein
VRTPGGQTAMEEDLGHQGPSRCTDSGSELAYLIPTHKH